VREWLGNAGARVQVVGGWPVDFWGLWCQIAVEAGCIGYAVVGDMVISQRWWWNVVVWWSCVGVEMPP
jgi:hypothetical protein